MRKIILFTLIFLSLFINSIAQPVSKKEALSFAKSFLEHKAKSNISLSVCKQVNTLSSIHQPAFYIFNVQPHGFIIVSANKKVKPILAYSLTSNFDTINIPKPINNVLKAYNKAITEIINSTLPTLTSYWQVSRYTTKGTKEVAPLIQTRWGQSPYYNQLCPDDCPTGCVTTATAQILKYYNHPTRGNGYHSYHSDHYGTLAANFGATTYRWNDMPNQLTSSTPGAQKIAVAQLMYQVAVALEVDFTPDESNTYPNLVAEILPEYFSYSSQAQFIKRSNYTLSSWKNTLKSELDNNRVILYTGFDSEHEVGHAFVMDGYDNNDLFHINWGWDGYYNGYFEINNLSPISSYAFNETQGAVIKIIPVDTYTDIKLFGDIDLSSQSPNYNDSLLVGVDVANYGNIQFYGDFKASLFDTNDVFISDIEILENVSINANDYTSLTFYTSSLGVVPGEYKLGIYFRNDGEDNWQLLDKDTYSNPITLQVSNQNTEGLISSSNIMVSPDPIQESNPVNIEFNIENNSDTAFYGNVGIWLHELNGNLVCHVKDTLVYFSAHENKNFVFDTVIADVMGTYKLILWYQPYGGEWKMVGASSYPNFKQVDVILTDAFALPPDNYETNNHLSEAYLIPENWDNNLATFETNGANIHSAYDDSADYYKFKLSPGYNYSIYAYIQDSYVDTNYTNDVIFKVKLSQDTSWSVYYDDDDMGVIDFDNISDTTYFYVCVNPFFIGNIGSYKLNVMIERNLICNNQKQPAKDYTIKISPNPATKFITIQTGTPYNMPFSIYSTTGQIIEKGVLNKQKTIDISKYPIGTYILKTANNSYKIVKN